ncbi:Dfp1/Him1, central region-domain-containing protein [Lipomyces tetrasporus]|uniref:Dfp1/Him1, central region-domain-containing protein n=1 Tax=Lipomyces tetrasporus TaxID=54092 RepID=A0AAD7QKX4_9ASCO|nr:Dfp1/Him1, central region-domain-containing protein [Lipomyces tetrasporus]KAJ8097138.1 Dfp1/Him1, central region-domain-containing protein [Lipomyces tetrasporus]
MSVSPVVSRQPLSQCSGNIIRSPSEAGLVVNRVRSQNATLKELNLTGQSSSTSSSTAVTDISKDRLYLSMGPHITPSSFASRLVSSAIHCQTAHTSAMVASKARQHMNDEESNLATTILNDTVPDATERSALSSTVHTSNRGANHFRHPSTTATANAGIIEPSQTRTFSSTSSTSVAISASGNAPMVAQQGLSVLSQVTERAREIPRDARDRAASLRERERMIVRARDSHQDKDRALTQVATNQNDASEQRDADNIRNWQRQWKRVLATSVFYFDGLEDVGKDRTKKQLLNYGAKIETFFHGGVTNVVTNRQIQANYAATDIIYQAKQRNMKIWTHEKFVRFMSHLQENPNASASNVAGTHTSTTLSRGHVVASDTSNNLCRMLREEKLTGPADSDPRARRDDIHYFKGPYIYIRDATQIYRPIMVREYSRVSEPQLGDWPQFRVTGTGKCPFVLDLQYHQNRTVKEVKPRRTGSKLKRAAAIEAEINTSKGAAKSRKLPEGEGDSHNQSANFLQEHEAPQADDDEGITEDLQQQASAAFKEPHLRKRSALTPVRMTSARANSGGPTAADIKARKQALSATGRSYHKRMSAAVGHELVATGINMSNVTSNIRSVTQSGGAANGLAAQASQVQSKEVNSLKKKVFERKRRPLPVPQVAVKKEAVAVKEVRPGYCENCKDKYDDYEEHVGSRKHRKFASNDENFAEIDDLLAQLVQPKRELHELS